jgi:hypothetical protein
MIMKYDTYVGWRRKNILAVMQMQLGMQQEAQQTGIFI